MRVRNQSAVAVTRGLIRTLVPKEQLVSAARTEACYFSCMEGDILMSLYHFMTGLVPVFEHWLRQNGVRPGVPHSPEHE
jgi:hypothetical protein